MDKDEEITLRIKDAITVNLQLKENLVSRLWLEDVFPKLCDKFVSRQDEPKSEVANTHFYLALVDRSFSTRKDQPDLAGGSKLSCTIS